MNVFFEEGREVMHRGKSELVGNFGECVSALSEHGFCMPYAKRIDVIDDGFSKEKLKFSRERGFVGVEEEAKLLYVDFVAVVVVDITLDFVNLR